MPYTLPLQPITSFLLLNDDGTPYDDGVVLFLSSEAELQDLAAERKFVKVMIVPISTIQTPAEALANTTPPVAPFQALLRMEDAGDKPYYSDEFGYILDTESSLCEFDDVIVPVMVVPLTLETFSSGKIIRDNLMARGESVFTEEEMKAEDEAEALKDSARNMKLKDAAKKRI
jgi:hypothetical protein